MRLISTKKILKPIVENEIRQRLKNQNFYFLEMNTRIQVEHPVSELVTDFDLVKAQICIAANEQPALNQSDFSPKGHAIECRINAEDPKTFMPSPGKVTYYHVPGGPGVRVDSHLYNGYSVPPYYASMIGKVITHGSTREIAIARMKTALNELVIEGIKTNIPLQIDIMEDTNFEMGGTNIHYLEKKLGLQ